MATQAKPRFTGTGLPIRASIIPFTSEFFNDENDHNPIVAQTCPECGGAGRRSAVTRISDAVVWSRVACTACFETGYVDSAVSFFNNDNPIAIVQGNQFGWIKCPACLFSEPIYHAKIRFKRHSRSIRQDCFSFNQGFKTKLVDQFPREYEMSVECSIDPPKNLRHLAGEFASNSNGNKCAITAIYESVHDPKAPMWKAAS